MNEIDVFRSVMTAKHDEALAAIRDFIVRTDDDEMCGLACDLINDADKHKDDPRAYLTACMAMLGLFHAWLTVMNDEE